MSTNISRSVCQQLYYERFQIWFDKKIKGKKFRMGQWMCCRTIVNLSDLKKKKSHINNRPTTKLGLCFTRKLSKHCVTMFALIRFFIKSSHIFAAHKLHRCWLPFFIWSDQLNLNWASQQKKNKNYDSTDLPFRAFIYGGIINKMRIIANAINLVYDENLRHQNEEKKKENHILILFAFSNFYHVYH